MVTQLVDVAPPTRARPPFDTVTITLHWTTVLIVLTLFGSGLLYGQVEERLLGTAFVAGFTARSA